MSLTVVMAMAAAGGAGALARVEVTAWCKARGAGRWATALVNVVGTTALALVILAGPSASTLTVLGTGLLGGFTTFSTWMVEATDRPTRGARTVDVLGPLALALLVVVVVRRFR